MQKCFHLARARDYEPTLPEEVARYYLREGGASGRVRAPGGRSGPRGGHLGNAHTRSARYLRDHLISTLDRFDGFLAILDGDHLGAQPPQKVPDQAAVVRAILGQQDSQPGWNIRLAFHEDRGLRGSGGHHRRKSRASPGPAPDGAAPAGARPQPLPSWRRSCQRLGRPR